MTKRKILISLFLYLHDVMTDVPEVGAEQIAVRSGRAQAARAFDGRGDGLIAGICHNSTSIECTPCSPGEIEGGKRVAS